jgi:hypothetical protein
VLWAVYVLAQYRLEMENPLYDVFGRHPYWRTNNKFPRVVKR